MQTHSYRKKARRRIYIEASRSRQKKRCNEKTRRRKAWQRERKRERDRQTDRQTERESNTDTTERGKQAEKERDEMKETGGASCNRIEVRKRASNWWSSSYCWWQLKHRLTVNAPFIGTVLRSPVTTTSIVLKTALSSVHLSVLSICPSRPSFCFEVLPLACYSIRCGPFICLSMHRRTGEFLVWSANAINAHHLDISPSNPMVHHDHPETMDHLILCHPRMNIPLPKPALKPCLLLRAHAGQQTAIVIP